MRFVFAATLLAVSVAASAHDAPQGFWGDSTSKSTWTNSYGQCWQTGTITREQAAQACGSEADSDGDGVADGRDRCNNTRKGAKVDANGCNAVLKEKVTVSIDVKFPTGEATVDGAGEKEVKKLADFMTQYPDARVEVGGHTDNAGDAEANKQLSQQRADAVRKTLIDKFGIDGNRISAVGYGQDKPVAGNDTEEGRAANRRVEGVVSQTVEKAQ